eukprot:CAMPEP_0172507114 /NCGR_PEP_ID=MMETSP1066-20121228/201334_1 /TAXON_ID=671091 /ORGANISM="Coscinodiscus wailesii, Strain CCMP2513" /LENGTH=208 /DNA_ID=CAMNT_0013284513 /DNA_START=58 /DNA_END=684 /DNA_ORIENTATION=+
MSSKSIINGFHATIYLFIIIFTASTLITSVSTFTTSASIYAKSTRRHKQVETAANTSLLLPPLKTAFGLNIQDDAPTPRRPITVVENNVLSDANGNEFTEDVTVVRVVRSGLKAYHVPKAGYGYFDEETKTFIPTLNSKDKLDRASKCLRLPVGLCGVVKRVYPKGKSDASHPILVAFDSGQEDSGGYDCPVKFSMHFQAREIECIIE